MILEFLIQAYGNGRSIIVAAYGNGGFTGCAEELDVAIFVFSEVDGFRVGSVGNAEFRGNIGDCLAAFIDIGNNIAGDVFG